LQVRLQEGVEVFGKQLTALLVQVILGALSVHRVYVNHRGQQIAQPFVFDARQMFLHQISLATPVSQQLGEFKGRSSLCPEFQQGTACRKDVHGWQQSVTRIARSKSNYGIGVYDRHITIATIIIGGQCFNESFGCNIAGSPSTRIEEVRIIRRIVLRQICGLKGGKVGEQNPVPRRNQDVLQLDVPVADLLFVALIQGTQNLERYPLFLQYGEKWSCGYAIIETVLHILPHYVGCLVDKLKMMINYCRTLLIGLCVRNISWNTPNIEI